MVMQGVGFSASVGTAMLVVYCRKGVIMAASRNTLLKAMQLYVATDAPW